MEEYLKKNPKILGTLLLLAGLGLSIFLGLNLLSVKNPGKWKFYDIVDLNIINTKSKNRVLNTYSLKLDENTSLRIGPKYTKIISQDILSLELPGKVEALANHEVKSTTSGDVIWIYGLKDASGKVLLDAGSVSKLRAKDKMIGFILGVILFLLGVACFFYKPKK